MLQQLKRFFSTLSQREKPPLGYLPHEIQQQFVNELDQDFVREIVTANNHFASDMYGRMGEAPGNLFFSPHSIFIALGLVYIGAKRETAEQMSTTLHLPREHDTLFQTADILKRYMIALEKHGLIELKSANALWPAIKHQVHILNSYVETVTERFGAQIIPLNYTQADKAVGRINKWATKQTAGRIKNILSPSQVSDDTTLILTNAIYFKGNWDSRFRKHNTIDDLFWLTAEECVDVPLMHQTSDFRYAQVDSNQILEMPYKGHALSMLVILPKNHAELDTVEAHIAQHGFSSWEQQFKWRDVEVYLPKFRFSTDYGLNGTLQSLGMVCPFKDNGTADFSGITDHPDQFYIETVIHKGFIEVTETGTEAAAVTAVTMSMAMSAPAQEAEPIPIFRADRPFIFAYP